MDVAPAMSPVGVWYRALMSTVTGSHIKKPSSLCLGFDEAVCRPLYRQLQGFLNCMYFGPLFMRPVSRRIWGTVVFRTSTWLHIFIPEASACRQRISFYNDVPLYFVFFFRVISLYQWLFKIFNSDIWTVATVNRQQLLSCPPASSLRSPCKLQRH